MRVPALKEAIKGICENRNHKCPEFFFVCPEFSKPTRRKIGLIFILPVILCFVFLAKNVKPGEAMATFRRQVTQEYGMVNLWVLKAWKDQTVQCELYFEHDQMPSADEFIAVCGDKKYEEWKNTVPCQAYLETLKSDSCTGSYLVYVGKANRSYEKTTILPPAEARFTLTACQAGATCTQPPRFRITGMEPLPGYTIKEIHTRISMRHNICKNVDKCEMELPQSTRNGALLEYWAVSSYGDESEHKTVRYRNVYDSQGTGTYYLDVLDPEINTNFASQQWKVFPSLEPTDLYFYTGVDAVDRLTTNNHLFYLSGQLINTGRVKNMSCSTSLLLSNGNATACGEEQAYNKVLDWQNQYDELIYDASKKYGLPARVIKGIIAQESQFWPNPRLNFEYGLGCLTEKGVDTLLMVDQNSFLSMCVPLYSEEGCASGYAQMTTMQRAYMRGLLLQQVGTDREIDLIARVVRAKSIEVGQIIQDASGHPPGEVSSYEDLWDFTIASYHAGGGCIKDGVKLLVDNKREINFKNYCSSVQTCPTACEFTNRVKNYVSPSTEEGQNTGSMTTGWGSVQSSPGQ